MICPSFCFVGMTFHRYWILKVTVSFVTVSTGMGNRGGSNAPPCHMAAFVFKLRTSEQTYPCPEDTLTRLVTGTHETEHGLA